MIFNTLVFVTQLFIASKEAAGSINFFTLTFALTPSLFTKGFYWQIFTYGFLHSTDFGLIPIHILMNMYGFYMLAGFLEPVIGKLKLVIVYFAAQLGGGAMVLLNAYVADNFIHPDNINQILYSHTLGASGSVFGLLVLFGYFFPDMELYILIFRVKARDSAWIMIIVGFLLEAFDLVAISNTAHLGGALVGFVSYHIMNRKKVEVLRFKIDIKDIYEKASPEMLQRAHIELSNKKILSDVEKMSSLKEKEEFLAPLQVQNANICTPQTFNTNDSYCLRCEWLPNCTLRKSREDSLKEQKSGD